MQDAVSVALEARSEGIRRFFDNSRTGAVWAGCETCERAVLSFFTLLTGNDYRITWPGPRVFVGEGDSIMVVTAHCRRPLFCTFTKFALGGKSAVDSHVLTIGQGCR